MVFPMDPGMSSARCVGGEGEPSKGPDRDWKPARDALDLAGALKFEDIAALKRINPDIIGVRGMVCGGDRNATIREDLIKTALALIR